MRNICLFSKDLVYIINLLGVFFEPIIVSGHFDLYMTSVLMGVMKKTQTQKQKTKAKKNLDLFGVLRKNNNLA